MYECGKKKLHSTYDRACAEHETTTSQMKDIVDILNYKIKEIRPQNRYMKNYIDNCYKESERRAAYPEQSTVHLENIANITFDSHSVIPQEKQNGSEKDCQTNP